MASSLVCTELEKILSIQMNETEQNFVAIKLSLYVSDVIPVWATAEILSAPRKQSALVLVNVWKICVELVRWIQYPAYKKVTTQHAIFQQWANVCNKSALRHINIIRQKAT